MLIIVVVVIFVIGLILFLVKLPGIIKAFKEGWQEGRREGSKKKE